MGLRNILAAMVALAVLLAPSISYAAMPMAATPDHGMQMMEMGHCQTPPSKRGDLDKAGGDRCCMAVCMAVAVTPPAPSAEVEPVHSATYFIVPQSWHGYLGEIATPPPRGA